MGISWRNGARPRQTLEIRWATSRIFRILGGPGRNRTRAEDANPIDYLSNYYFNRSLN